MPTSTPSAGESPEVGRERRRQIAGAKLALRELRIELAALNHRVGSRAEIKDADFDCLDIITRHGPLSPTALAQRTGVPLATMTGILDRLERGGWIARERDPSDRRSVLVRTVRARNAEVFRLYAGMNSAMDEIFGRYDDAELEVLADFLRRTVDAGRAATDDLSAD
jgi:DNA-binding MarR family transcriptional regulator